LLVVVLTLVGVAAVGFAGSAREFSPSALEGQQARYGRV
jgi:hypothetical protein